MAEAVTTTILNVNDSEPNRYALSLALRRAGFRLLEAATGEEALARVAAGPDEIDLVLLDVNLPGISGLEVCRRLKADPGTALIPVLQISATRVELDDRIMGLESGADGYLNQSVELRELMATVRALLRMRHAEMALARRERELKLLLENLPDIISRLDGDFRHLYVNPAVTAATGRLPEQFLGRTHRELGFPEATCAVWEAQMRNVFATGQEASFEFELAAPAGPRWYHVRVVPEPAAEDAPATLLAVATDIHDRKMLEEERAGLLASERAAREEAEQSGRIKDEFLATLSHELRTPLNAILGWAHLLKSQPPNAEQLARGVATIERNARVQTQLIEDLLDMSRIISGKLRLDLQRVDVAGVIEAAVESVRPAAEAREIRLQTVLDPLAGPVMGDPNRLQQVVWNLLSNAIKFSAPGGCVQVILERGNSHVEISVSDQGQGISPEFLPRVFDRFRQADASTTRSHTGLGLGLAIVKNLTDLHGGSVRAESSGEGQGATFSVMLPLSPVRAEEAEERVHPWAATGSEDAAVRLAGVKVLVVDDEPDARELIAQILQECEAEVTTARSAQEALTLLPALRPGVLVSDIGMPGEDGYSLIRRLRKQAPEAGGDTPAVALTAFARSEDRTRAMRAGYQIHLAKPVEPAELVAIVALLAGRRDDEVMR